MSKRLIGILLIFSVICFLTAYLASDVFFPDYEYKFIPEGQQYLNTRPGRVNKNKIFNQVLFNKILIGGVLVMITITGVNFVRKSNNP